MERNLRHPRQTVFMEDILIERDYTIRNPKTKKKLNEKELDDRALKIARCNIFGILEITLK
jgi:hypothetical protein